MIHLATFSRPMKTLMLKTSELLTLSTLFSLILILNIKAHEEMENTNQETLYTETETTNQAIHLAFRKSKSAPSNLSVIIGEGLGR
jgi:hypothetical protein